MSKITTSQKTCSQCNQDLPEVEYPRLHGISDVRGYVNAHSNVVSIGWDDDEEVDLAFVWDEVKTLRNWLDRLIFIQNRSQ